MSPRRSRTGRAVALVSALCGPIACGNDSSGRTDAESAPAAEPAASAAATTDFRTLFDGATLEGWRGYRMAEPPAGWSAQDGTLAFTPSDQGGGDLVTVEQFSSFELELEWMVAEGGNSGIFFHVTEEHDWPWESGPEMQVLDNAGHADGQSPLTSAGSNFALHGPSEDVSNGPGEWNGARLIVDGDRVEHWLNGTKVVEYTLGSPDWEARVADSKFAEMPGYGRARSGHIALQDHGDPVRFRNLRIRELDP